MRKSRLRPVFAALAVLALAASACRSDSADDTASDGDSPESTEATSQGSVDFGSLENVCQDGDASLASAQGVTDDSIQVGVFTDFGFTQNSEFLDAAEVFTSWCNDAGGINGRQLTFEVRDAKLFEYRQRILEACASDFMLVGGGAAFDGNGVKDRLECGLPEIVAQTVSYENQHSGFQVEPAVNTNPDIVPYEGYYRWLLTEKYPDSADKVGLIAGDIGPTVLFSNRERETVEFVGGTMVYTDVYPATGVSNWQPYALALEDAGVEGLIFLGNFVDLPKLEQALADVDHDLTWIDANTNAYNEEFLELAGPLLERYPNYSAPTIYPIEAAAGNEAMQQFVDIFERYMPDVTITGPMIQAWSAWLNFAVSARDCGDELTRSCVFENARSYEAWDGGGIQGPQDLSDPESREYCFVVMRATPERWVLDDFGANTGAFRCEEHQHSPTGDYPDPVTIEDVGVTVEDLD